MAANARVGREAKHGIWNGWKEARCERVVRHKQDYNRRARVLLLQVSCQSRRRQQVSRLQMRADSIGQVAIPKRCAVLFVCLGNICRSPTAEAVMKMKMEKLRKEGKNDNLVEIVIDSCGTGGGSSNWFQLGGFSYHEGERPDARMTKAGKCILLEMWSNNVFKCHFPLTGNGKIKLILM